MFVWRGLFVAVEAISTDITRQSGACVASIVPPLGIVIDPTLTLQGDALFVKGLYIQTVCSNE